MARQLSPEKRESILQAAIDVVAAEGVSAPTAKIAKKAGIAEGTLFTYFPTKDDLLNSLYVELKTELGLEMEKRYPREGSLRERAEHVWERYIRWGAAALPKYKALRQLAVTERVTEESRQVARRCMGHLCDVLSEAGTNGQSGSSDFTTAILGALADATLEIISREPRRVKHYARLGFEAFWRAIGAEEASVRKPRRD